MQGLHTPPPKVSGSSFFTPLLISMAGIVTTCMIILTYHLVLVKCRRRRRRGHENNISSTSRRRQRRGGSSDTQLSKGGVDKKILEAIPVHSYLDNLVHSRSECVVCLGELEDGDQIRLLPSCRHVFHVSCIDEWFSNHTSCPICRKPINSIRSHENVNVEDPTVVNLRLNDPLMMMSMEERNLNRLRLMTKLKRSLSMDQSYVVFNRQRQEEQTNGGTICPCRCSCSGSISKNEARPMRQLDRVSSMLVRSFSLLRMSQSSTNSNAILPS